MVRLNFLQCMYQLRGEPMISFSLDLEDEQDLEICMQAPGLTGDIASRFLFITRLYTPGRDPMLASMTASLRDLTVVEPTSTKGFMLTVNVQGRAEPLSIPVPQRATYMNVACKIAAQIGCNRSKVRLAQNGKPCAKNINVKLGPVDALVEL